MLVVVRLRTDLLALLFSVGWLVAGALMPRVLDRVHAGDPEPDADRAVVHAAEE